MNDFCAELHSFLNERNYVSPWILSNQAQNPILASACSITTIKKKRYLFLQGDENHNVYIVRTGRLRIFYSDLSSMEKCIYIVEQGGMVGETSAFDQAPNYASAYAITDATLFKIHIQDLMRLINLHPSLSLRVIESLNYKVRLLSSQMEYFTKSAPVRVVSTLIALCARYGAVQPDGSVRISIRFTHEEMSNLINLNRVTVSKVFSDLLQNQIITNVGGHIVVPKIDILKSYLDERL